MVITEERSPTIKKNTNRILLIAAVALILILIGFIFFRLYLNPSENAGEEAVVQVMESTGEESPGQDDLLDEHKSMVIAEDDNSVTILDARGREVVIDKHPKRVIPLQNTLLDLWYLAGGTAVGRVSGTVSVPEEAMDLPEVGRTTTPNIELILAQNPDLVIMNAWTNSHVEFESILEENGIPYFYTGTSVDPYENILKSLYVFSRLTGDEKAYRENVVTIASEANKIIDRVADKQAPDVLVLFGCSKFVKAEMDNGLVGEMISMLGGHNVVENVNIKGESKVDFSLEAIVEADPDYILVSVMGDVDAAKDRLTEDMEKNEAWASLTAVQEGQIHYLPKELYLYKPNDRYPEALKGLAEILYPDLEIK